MQMNAWKAKKGQMKVEQRFLIFYLGVQTRNEVSDLYVAPLLIHPVSNHLLDS